MAAETPPLGSPGGPYSWRERWFDQWSMAAGEPLKDLAGMVQGALASFELRDREESRPGARARQRKEADGMRFAAMLETVVAELAYTVLAPSPSGRLAVMLAHPGKGRSRYDNPAFGKGLSPLLARLADAGALNLRLGKKGGSATTIAPSEWFATMVEGYEVSLKDFGRDPYEEVVILNRNTPGLDWSSGAPERVTMRERVNYRDTPDSIRYRAEVRCINDYLAHANINFIDDGETGTASVDPFKRTLRRYFVAAEDGVGDDDAPLFDRMGRLFGDAFWLNLSGVRRANIRIDGERCANLDFSSMFLRLVYASANEAAPEGDLYAIPGLEAADRAFVKFAVNCFLCDRGQRSGWPKDRHEGAPKGLTPRVALKAILEAHPVMDGVAGTGAGMQLMMLESSIMVATLLKLVENGVTALPLHDGLLVAASKAEVAAEAMKAAAEAIAGVRLPVACKAAGK